MTSLLYALSDVPLPMRPISDKEMGVADLDQILEEYVETDYLQHLGDATTDRSSSDDLSRLFELPSSSGSDLFGTSSSPTLNQDTAAAWHKALQSCEQNPTSPVPGISTSKSKEPPRNSGPLSFEENIGLDKNLNLLLRSSSRPPTPQPNTPRTVKKAVSFNDRSASNGIQKLPKKSASTSFTKMMQSSYYRTPTTDGWLRKMDVTTHPMPFQPPHTDISSPPPSSRIVPHENSNGFFAQEHQPYGVNRSPLATDDPHTPNIDFSNYQLTPQASPAIGISAHGNNNNSNTYPNNIGIAYTSSTSSAAISALHTPPSSIRLPMTTWGPETSPTLEAGFSAAPEFCSSKTAGWWNDSAHHPTTTSGESSSSRSSGQNTGLAAPMGGLGISCDTTSFGEFSSMGLGAEVAETPLSGTSAPSYDIHGYPALYTSPPPPPPQQNLVNIGHRRLSRSPSPIPQPRFHRRRPSGQSYTQHHHRASHSSTASTRRKSSNASLQSSRQQPAGGSGFVNFTPDDSRKILTGVAPSGSSKTKARREKEAADKRRKLSQAAMKAVMEAGGDIDSLRRLENEGLLMLDS